jgi:hypothetical protein
MRIPFPLLFALTVLVTTYCRRPEAPLSLIRIQQQGKIGYIDPEGKMVVPAVYENGSDFSEGLAAIRTNGYYGYIDTTGRFTIQPQFDWAEPFSEELAAVNKDGHFFYINRSGASAFPCPFTTLSAFEHQVAMVRTAGKHWGLIDHFGQLVLDTIYNVIRDFDDGLAFVDRDVKDGPTLEGVIDTTGHFIIPIGKYASVGYPKQGYCIVSDTSGHQILVDRKGREILRRLEKGHTGIALDGFTEGIAPVNLYKDWEPERPGVYYTSEEAYMGYIDMDQHLLLSDTLVERAMSFSGNRAFIKLRTGNYRVIDRQMRRIGKDEYFMLRSEGFVNGHAIVILGYSDLLIDTTGSVVFRPADDHPHELSFLGDQYLIDKVEAFDSTRFGILTVTGRSIFPPQLEAYDQTGFHDHRLKVVLAGRLAVLDTTGRVVWRDTSRRSATLPPLNIDYMLRGYFCAYSAPDTRGETQPSGGWAVSHNTPHKIAAQVSSKFASLFDTNRLQLVIDTGTIDTFSSAYRGYRIYLANSTRDTARFDAEDSRLYLSTEAQGPDGVWKAIDYLPSSWCGNSYHTVDLDPGAYWTFTMPQFDGAIPVNIRLRLEGLRLPGAHPRDNQQSPALYSNTIRGRVNPAQFWNKLPYTPQGLMDPYNE